jgi:hypothetical protein
MNPKMRGTRRNPSPPTNSVGRRLVLRIASLVIMALGALVLTASVRQLSKPPLPVYGPPSTGMTYRYGTSGQLAGIAAGIFFLWLGYWGFRSGSSN